MLLPLQSEDLPLGLTSVTVGTGVTTGGATVTLSLPYTANLNPEGPLSGAGTLVIGSLLKSASLIAGDVSQSSQGAFSQASCDFYDSSSSVSGLTACTGNIVGSGTTNTQITFSGPASCVACSYTTGEDGTFNE